MIAVIDYDAGNLFSVANALERLGIDYVFTADPAEIEKADGIILPGVGAFPDAMEKLSSRGLVPVLQRCAKEKPFLGICLGMQVLFEEGEEFTLTKGLGLLPGRVVPIEAPGLKVPHMGWNGLVMEKSCPLTENLPESPYVYFVHSFCAAPKDEVLVAWCEYGQKVPALVWDGNCCFGAQFHPEKSGDVGLAILKNFAGLCR